MLGVLRHGATLLVVDPDDPEAYVAALLAASGAVALVDAEGAVTALDAAPSSANVVDGGGLLLHAPDTHRRVALDALTADGLAALLGDLRERLHVGPDDVVVATLSPGADASALEILLAATAGARLVLAADHAADADALAAALTHAGATLLVATIDTYRALAAAGWRPGAELRLVVTGGPVAGDDARLLLAFGAPLFVATDVAGSGAWTALAELRANEPRLLLGAPLGHARPRVLDPAGAPAPTGVWGELYVGDRDAGVRARRCGDGALEQHAGDGRWCRIDGRRISLASVEELLRGRVGNDAVAVRPQPDAVGRTCLVAYVETATAGDVTESELRAAVRAALPRQAVPRMVVELDALPRDAAGALLPARLPSPFAATGGAAPFVAPRTPAERLLGRVWQELLGVERVDVTDNFFALGGFSLLAFQAIERIHAESGVRLSPRALLLGTLEQAALQLAMDPTGAATAPMPADAPTATSTTTASSRGLLHRLRERLTGAE